MKNGAVIYFSESGYTYAAAVKLSVGCHMDICKIVPSMSYSTEDLNYENPECRTYLEASDQNARPDILDPALDIAKYDLIFIGFPIWYKDMPKVIYTFLENYDFSGKEIVPFATSKGSTLETITTTIRALCPDSKVHEGMLLNGCPSHRELKLLVNEILNNR